MFSDTIEGGAFLSADGTTWHDADGKVLNKADAERAQKQAAEAQRQLDEQEAGRLQAESQRDPVARALAAVMQQQGKAK